MISIPFDYARYPRGTIEDRMEMIKWVRMNNGTIKRRTGRINILGVLTHVEFENELDAIAFKLRYYGL